MAFCLKCGAALVQGAAFCGKCGAPVPSGAADRLSPAPPPAAPQPQYTPPPAAAPYAPPPPPQMHYTPPSARTALPPGLVARVTNILTKPKVEWPVIEGEAATVAGLYSGYIVILAAIPVIATFLKTTLIGTTMFLTTVRVGMAAGLVGAILQYAFTLGGVYLAAFIIDKLAPNFQSQSDLMQALKLVAYAYTAAWVGGAFHILPIIGILGVLAGGIYSICLFYLGLPVMMKTPPDKVIIYMIVSAVVIFVIYLVIGVVVGAIMAAAFLGGSLVSPGL